MIVLLCGLSGAGKTTLAHHVKTRLENRGIETEIIDGDEYRKTLSKDLGFSRADRMENIRRLGFVANKFSSHSIVTLVSAINPYEEIRKELRASYEDVKLVYIHCGLETLIQRDTKGLYKRALLPPGHPDKITNLTGVNDDFDVPQNPDLSIQTDQEDIETSIKKLFEFITEQIKPREIWYKKGSRLPFILSEKFVVYNGF